ncbi:MAG: hypothetical protein K2H67_03535, partial [Treponemataceae bacterium]|nr:hypothetical protein [Treponemataceae bacterium]
LAFLIGDRPPLGMGGGYNGLGFFASALLGLLTSQGVALLTKFSSKTRAYSIRICARAASPGAFSPLKSAFVAFFAQFWLSKALPNPHLVHFQPSGAFPRLPQRVFGLQKYFRYFPRAFSAFKSTFVASLVHFQRSKVLPKPHSARFVVARRAAYRVFPAENSRGRAGKHFQFGSNKNHHKLRSFYET